MLDDDFISALRTSFPLFRADFLPETTAAEVPGWDSFGHVQLIFELEDSLNVSVDPEAALQCSNVGELQEMIRNLRHAS